jgi:hypothetical protein
MDGNQLPELVYLNHVPFERYLQATSDEVREGGPFIASKEGILEYSPSVQMLLLSSSCSGLR